MTAWLSFIKERLPLASYALIVGGFVMTAKAVTQTPWTWELLIPFVGLFFFFIELRLMDELKDYSKDVVAHPQRPLPRGLISVSAMKKVVNAGLVVMWVFAGLSFLLNSASAISYALTVLYLYLMYKEFFVGESLANKPFLYACTHQIIIVLLLVYAAASLNPEAIHSDLAYLAGFVILGCFFTYEVARKMDPKAHPILKTYLSVYGKKGVTVILIFLQLVSWIAAILMKEQVVLFGLIAGSALLFLSWFAFMTNEAKFKLVETAGTLCLLISLYVIPLSLWLTRG
nr:UbiA family prenyltransferase [uncultured Bdellovibrio sp.]